jgi:pimeloyl-ACP methyl ester carboxylesterase
MRIPRRRAVMVACCLAVFVGVNGYLLWSEMGGTAKLKSDARGFFRKQYVDPSGKSHNYMVFVPYDYQPGQRRPLLLFLNGVGENGTDGMSAISNNFGVQIWEMKRDFPFVAAVPQCEPGKSWTDGEDTKALAILDRVAADYGTDPDRVYMTGVSSGAGGVWHIAREHPDRFAAIVPLCGSPSASAETASTFAKAHLPIWNFWNQGDEKSLVESNRQMHQKLLEAGESPLATECRQVGHDSWNEGYRSMALYDWLLDRSRAKNASRTRRFTLLSSDDVLSRWKTLGPSRWMILDAQRLGSETDDKKLPGYLVSDVAYRRCEFHVEVRPRNETDECQLVLVEDATVPDKTGDTAIKGYTLHLPFAEQGTGGLAHSAGGWIAPLDPAAQRQLRVGYWNDLRVCFGDDRIVVYLNGWKAIDVSMLLGEKAFRVALVASRDIPAVQWRNLRIREPQRAAIGDVAESNNKP